jgi:Holliday junction resolvase
MSGREADVQREIVATLKQLGYWVARIQSGKVKVRGGWMQLAPEGTADLLAIRGEKTIWIECKRPKGGTHSAEQKEFMGLVRRAGHQYVVARSKDDVLEAVKR